MRVLERSWCRTDEKKARHYTELAAICGGVSARHNLSIMEFHAGNLDKPVKHAMIAAGFGHARSLKFIQLALIHGFAMKGGYEKALRAYQQYLEAVRSDQRDDAAAYHHDLKYLDNHLSRD
jgi:TPR repeat protein